MHDMGTPPPLPVKHYMYIGVGVGWQRYCKTCQSLRGQDNQVTVFFGGVLAVTMMMMMVIELSSQIILCGVENHNSAQEECSHYVLWIVYGTHDAVT